MTWQSILRLSRRHLQRPIQRLARSTSCVSPPRKAPSCPRSSSNALIIIGLIPLALRGIQYRPIGAGPLLRRHLLVYGVGGILVPFVGIKLIDMLLTILGLI